MFPLTPLALRALLFTAAFASGALLLRAREAHSCPPPCPESRGERLILRAVSIRVDGVAQPIPGLNVNVSRFGVANNWVVPEEDFVSAQLYDVEHPDTPRERLLRRQP